MEAGSETATAQNDAEVTVVIKKAAKVAEEPATEKAGDVDVVTTIKLPVNGASPSEATKEAEKPVEKVAEKQDDEEEEEIEEVIEEEVETDESEEETAEETKTVTVQVKKTEIVTKNGTATAKVLEKQVSKSDDAPAAIAATVKEEPKPAAAATKAEPEKVIAAEVIESDGSVEQEEEEIAQDGDEDETKVTADSRRASEVPKPVEAAPAQRQAEETKKPVAAPQEVQLQADEQQRKQSNFSSALKEIITDIDSNIREAESIATLKQQQQDLIAKQQELAQQIRQQQLLAQQLAKENQLHQQQLMQQQQRQQQQQHQEQQQRQQQQQQRPQYQTFQPAAPSLSNLQSQPQRNVAFSTFEESQDENSYIRKMESYESKESSNVSKTVDLHKIFTPATDATEITPKNRKLYASSAFYSPTLHPTVEDQVALARRISHSLSDISNQKSKGQSMYVNRKKRSVKWVHEGSGQGQTDACIDDETYKEEYKENTERTPLDKLPLRLLMNPRGQIHDLASLPESLITESGLLSPDNCAELITALQTQKGRGAELFAKRRRKAEKWVVDESNAGTQSPSGLPDYHPYQPQVKPPTSPSIVPAYSDAGKHRVQLNIHQEQLIEKYAKPGLKVVKTPWEAALETGSASTAFIEQPRHSPAPTLSPAPPVQYHDTGNYAYGGGASRTVPDAAAEYGAPVGGYHMQQHKPSSMSSESNQQRELAYKPSIPQGWKAPNMVLPKELYVPKEIPLDSYAPPPSYTQKNSFPSDVHTWKPASDTQSWKPAASLGGHPYAPNTHSSTMAPETRSFPISAPSADRYTSSSMPVPMGSSPVPPKQQYWEPRSYQKVPQTIGQTVPQVNFNPSPLPYDKLAKFENPESQQSPNTYYSPPRQLAIRGGGQLRNTTPTPYGGGGGHSPTYDKGHSTSVSSPRPPSQQYSTYSNEGYDNHSTPSSSHGISAGDLLNAPSYNSSARGWRSGGCYRPQTKPVAIATGSLPYTDF